MLIETHASILMFSDSLYSSLFNAFKYLSFYFIPHSRLNWKDTIWFVIAQSVPLSKIAIKINNGFLLRTFLIERKNFLSENLEIKVEVIIPLFPGEMQKVWNTCIASIFLSKFQMACISIEKYDVIEFTLTYNTWSGCNMMKMDLKCHLLSHSAQAEHPLLKATWDGQTQ